MNSKLKNEENAHLFEMDFSEFVLPRKKNTNNATQKSNTKQEQHKENKQYQIKKEQHVIGHTQVKHQARQQNELDALTLL